MCQLHAQGRACRADHIYHAGYLRIFSHSTGYKYGFCPCIGNVTEVDCQCLCKCRDFMDFLRVFCHNRLCPQRQHYIGTVIDWNRIGNAVYERCLTDDRFFCFFHLFKHFCISFLFVLLFKAAFCLFYFVINLCSQCLLELCQQFHAL